MTAALVCTWYGEFPQLRRRIAEWEALNWPVIVLNDGHPERRKFARTLPRWITGISKHRDQGFCSHQLRNWALDFVDEDWVLLTDLDISWPEQTIASLNDFVPDATPRWMFKLTVPVTGYAPIEGDIHGRTKQDVHPNIHLLPRDAGRYDSSLFGKHTGDGEFFQRLHPDYGVWPEPVTMEPRK